MVDRPLRLPAFSAQMSVPGSIDPDSLMAATVGFYGGAMMQVQMFELVLAGLVLAVELTPPSEPPPDPEAFLKKAWDLVHKASADRMRRRLKGNVPDDLLREIVALVSWRNFLAHRYLRTRLTAPDGASMRATGPDAAELMKLTWAFRDGTQRVTKATGVVFEAARSAGGITSPPGAALASIDDLLLRMIRAQPPRFESIAATPSGDPV
jgi:hypothetical protein